MNYGIQISLHTSTIKATPIQYDRFDRIITCLNVDRVGQLHLSTSTNWLIADNVKDIWRQNITTNAGKFWWRFFALLFFSFLEIESVNVNNNLPIVKLYNYL